MAVYISDNENVCLYDSVTGLPLNIEVFSDSNEAVAFLEWATQTYEGDIRETGAAAVLSSVWNEHLHDQWETDFYTPIFGARCQLCGNLLGTETLGVHTACSDSAAVESSV